MGDVIGTSGNTGCSNGPHLRFQGARILSGREVLIDPYGWRSQEADPWLWRPGAAPRLFRRVAIGELLGE